MSFLRRLAGTPRAAEDPWATAPDWAAGITPGGFRRIAIAVQREVGPDRVPDVLALRDFATAAELSIPNLIPVLAKVPPERWEPMLHDFYSQTGAFRSAGDAIEARSQTLDEAVAALRVHWMAASARPPGDVFVDGPVAGTVEVLALDAGDSIRYVSERLFSKWNVAADDAVRLARERVLALPVMPLDWEAHGHPAVRGLSLEREGPYVGALFHGLDRVAPEAVGLFGSLVGVPVGNAMLWRALDPSPGIADDIIALAVFTHTFADKTKDKFLHLPVWRRPEGRSTLVRLRLADDGTLLGSHHAGFNGVLAALDVLPPVDVPGWARASLDPAAYTRFAGCVAAVREIGLDDVARVGSAWSLPGLAADCSRLPFEDWPRFVADHLDRIAASEDAARAIIANASADPDAARRSLVTWLDVPQAPEERRATRPVGGTGLVEVLGVYAVDHAVPVPADVQPALGDLDELFRIGAHRIETSLVVEDGIVPMLSADARWVTGDPSPSGAALDLLSSRPNLCGPYGAVVALGSAARLLVLPITDASVALDLPAMLGHAVGGASNAAWALPPTVLFVMADGVQALRLDASDGQARWATPLADLAQLIARLPGKPARLPPGLVETLGAEASLRFYALLHAEVVARLQASPANLVELTPLAVGDFALGVRGERMEEWPRRVAAMLDEVAAPRLELDRLAGSADYAEIAPALRLRVSRPALAGSELAQDVPGGLVAFPVLQAGQRHRRVARAMLDHWGVTQDRCHADALANTAFDPDLVDQPMFPDNPAVRELYSRTGDREAAALGLHLRHPGSPRGFVISITHGSRAHYVVLDDPRGFPSVPVFARIMAEIYANADAASDAHSPWLVWLRPDGRTVALFDVRGPMPGRDGLPAAFAALLGTGTAPRRN